MKPREAQRAGDGYRHGQVRDRYQLYNERTERFDKYDGEGNLVMSKTTPGPYKGVEEQAPKKPPRG